MRDVCGSTINTSGRSTVDVKLGGPDGEASCRVALQVGAVSTNVFSVCMMIHAGICRLELDADGNGGSYLVRKTTRGQVGLNRRGFIFCLGARGVRPSQVCVVRELQEDEVLTFRLCSWLREGFVYLLVHIEFCARTLHLGTVSVH